MYDFTKHHYKEAGKRLILLLACSFFLLFPALYNGAPLVTPDSGAYISSGWLLHVPVDRPITYSIFVRAASLSGLSLWGVLWAQAFILVYYLKQVSKKILGRHFSPGIFCCIVLMLSVFTSCSWVVSQLMPDIFTPILFLSILDFYLSPNGSARKKMLSFFIIWFFIQQHNSNLLIVLLFCIAARFYMLFVHKRKWFVKKTNFLFGVTVFSFISISFFNLWEGNSFRPSAGTHVFLMARMAENGILDSYLKDYCPTEHYSLCNHQGQTGNRQWDFMWSNPALPHSSGWDKAEKEYNQILFRSLTRPKYLGLHICESIKGTFRQLTQIPIGLMVQGEGTSPDNAVRTYFPRERKEYLTSLQQLNQLSPIMAFFNGISFVFMLVTAIITLLYYRKKDQDAFMPNWKFMVIITVVAVILNAFVTSTFSTVIDRLQTRVVWMIPFCTTLFLIKSYLKNGFRLQNSQYQHQPDS